MKEKTFKINKLLLIIWSGILFIGANKLIGQNIDTTRIFFPVINSTAENQGQTLKNVNFNFFCHGGEEVISLPSDFMGPKYERLSDGLLVYFVVFDSVNAAVDYCMVNVWCGHTTEINVDSTYLPIENSLVEENKRDILLYSKEKNRYARRTYLKRYFIMYTNASLARKEVLDEIIDSLKQKEQK